jgi:hypothetical protein
MIKLINKSFYKTILKSIYTPLPVYSWWVEGRGYQVEAFSLLRKKSYVFQILAYSSHVYLYMKRLYKASTLYLDEVDTFLTRRVDSYWVDTLRGIKI